MAAHLSQRAVRYQNALEPSLLSIITPIWDGSPLGYLRELAHSIALQIEGNAAQWFILANGCSRPDLLALLRDLGMYPFVTVHYESKNAGIVKGLRLCLEQATGRYVLPVDADDKLYPDALRIVTAHIQEQRYPPLLYTDEDKVSGSGIYQPYFKPDWDPVLLANSAYIAHLGVVDRELALQLDAYGDNRAEGSADWDLFTRFGNAGHRAVHIPEVVYSWRIHAESTADDAAAKPYIRSSQQAVLRRFLNAQPAGGSFDIETSPLFGPNAAHLHFVRRQTCSTAFLLVENAAHLSDLLAPTEMMVQQEGFIGLRGRGIDIRNPDWIAEALGLFELFPDAAMVGGRFCDTGDVIVDGPQYLGFNGVCGCPDTGREVTDPGYFGQMWKQHSVSAVSAKLALIRATDLLPILQALAPEATLPNLGCWIGAEALRHNRRIIYTPFLYAIVNDSFKVSIDEAEKTAFRNRYNDLIPDRRFYPEPFSLDQGYQLPQPKP